MSSKDAIRSAIKDAHAVFLMTTPSYTDPSVDEEGTFGRNVTDVAKEVGVQHLIYSSLISASQASGGKLTHVTWFDRKAEVEHYIRESGVPATFLLPGYFMSNYITFQMMRKNEDGTYMLAYPVSAAAKFPLIDAAVDTGM